MKDFGFKILIVAAIILVTLRLIFEWDHRKTAWIEGTSILIVTIIVTIISSMTEYTINKTII